MDFTERELKEINERIKKDDEVIIMTENMACGKGTSVGLATLVVQFLASEYRQKNINKKFLYEIPKLVQEMAQNMNVKSSYKQKKKKQKSNELNELENIVKDLTDLLEQIEKL